MSFSVINSFSLVFVFMRQIWIRILMEEEPGVFMKHASLRQNADFKRTRHRNSESSEEESHLITFNELSVHGRIHHYFKATVQK